MKRKTQDCGYEERKTRSNRFKYRRTEGSTLTATLELESRMLHRVRSPTMLDNAVVQLVDILKRAESAAEVNCAKAITSMNAEVAESIGTLIVDDRSKEALRCAVMETEGRILLYNATRTEELLMARDRFKRCIDLLEDGRFNYALGLRMEGIGCVAVSTECDSSCCNPTTSAFSMFPPTKNGCSFANMTAINNFYIRRRLNMCMLFLATYGFPYSKKELESMDANYFKVVESTKSMAERLNYSCRTFPDSRLALAIQMADFAASAYNKLEELCDQGLLIPHMSLTAINLLSEHPPTTITNTSPTSSRRRRGNQKRQNEEEAKRLQKEEEEERKRQSLLYADTIATLLGTIQHSIEWDPEYAGKLLAGLLHNIKDGKIDSCDEKMLVETRIYSLIYEFANHREDNNNNS